MKVSKHGQFLYKLTFLKMVSCYLVTYENGFILIDTGLSTSARGINATVKNLNLPITHITLTHSHIDHAGSFDKMSQLWPEAEIVLTERMAQFLKGERGLLPHEPSAKLRGGYLSCKTQPTVTLKPGEKLGPLEIISTPGHTPAHIAFFDHRDGTLIVGDAFHTLAGITVTGQRNWRLPIPAWDKETALQSAKDLLALKPARLAVGHGPVLEKPQPAMAEAIARAKTDKK